MRDIYRTPPIGLSHELAVQNPERFGQLAIAQLADSSVLGPQVWNFTVNKSVVVPDRLSIDPTTWVSRSNAKGYIKLGAQPMEAPTKDRILYRSEGFSYPDEVSYRLLHETTHSFLFLTQKLETTRRLMRLTADVRGATQGASGLTALGSLSFYEGDAKIIEDTTELMTMYAWDPGYARKFANFLATAENWADRDKVGLVTISDPDPVYNTLRDAVETGLRAA